MEKGARRTATGSLREERAARRADGSSPSETSVGETSLEEVIMAVVFHIPGPLRDFTAGSSSVEILSMPATLRDALELLCGLHPGIRDRVLTEQGQLRPHINVFVGTEDVRYMGGLKTRITEADTISILPAVSGG